jgi:hypothetical protein
MRRIVLSGVIAIMGTVESAAQTGPTPRFNDYPTRVEVARAKAIDFRRSPEARTFKTRLGQALRHGVNFAGRFIIAGWGCGTCCISGAIIDARTGVVYWPEQLNAMGVWYGDGDYADEPVKYRKNSRLLVITGSPGVRDGEEDKPSGEYYYEWRANRLRLVKFVAKESN